MSMTPPTSRSKFLEAHMNNVAPRIDAGDGDPIVGGGAVEDHEGRQRALTKGPFISATPKFSTGSRSRTGPNFPTHTDNTVRFP